MENGMDSGYGKWLGPWIWEMVWALDMMENGMENGHACPLSPVHCISLNSPDGFPRPCEQDGD
jgi:hypothetical protein